MYIEIGLLIAFSLVIVACSTLFALIESSIIVTDEIKLQILLNRSDLKEKTKKRIKKIMKEKDKHLTAMVIASTITNILGSSLLGAMSSKYLEHTEILIFTVIFTYLILVFARTVPKIIASYAYDRVLMKVSFIPRFFFFINYPFILLTLIWVKILKLENQRQMSLNELKMIIKHYRKSGVIQKSEQKLLEKIFNVKQNIIADVMEHFDTLEMEYDHSIRDYRNSLLDSHNKRFFVKKDDEIAGIVFYRDIASALLSEEDMPHLVSEFCRQAITLKADENLMDAIVQFKDAGISLAVVLNDEGRAIGTVTIKQVYNYVLES